MTIGIGHGGWVAEVGRLQREVETGCGRRMLADTLAGRSLARADMEQADRYQAAIRWLTEHGDSDVSTDAA